MNVAHRVTPERKFNVALSTHEWTATDSGGTRRVAAVAGFGLERDQNRTRHLFCLDQIGHVFNRKDFEILAVSTDAQGPSVTRPFRDDMRLTFPILHDSDFRVGVTYGTRTLPMTFLVDRHAIFHQANGRLLSAVGKRVGLAPEKLYSVIERIGNPSSASLPIALDCANREGRLRAGDLVVLGTFGGGLTWATGLVRW